MWLFYIELYASVEHSVVALCKPLKLDIWLWQTEANAIEGQYDRTKLLYVWNSQCTTTNAMRIRYQIEQESVLTFIIISVIFVVIFGFS